MASGRTALIGVAFGCLGIAAALVACEVGLAGVHYETFPTVQFGWPEPTVVERDFVPDRELFWVPRDYDAMLTNATRLHPALVFLGDSCTRIGTWPQQTTELLRSRGLPLTSVKLAVMVRRRPPGGRPCTPRLASPTHELTLPAAQAKVEPAVTGSA